LTLLTGWLLLPAFLRCSASGVQRTIWCETISEDIVVNRLPRTFGCPVELSLELLGGKWKAVILARLKDGPLRYGELRRLIPQLSDKVLTDRLADLRQAGLIAPGGGKRGDGYRLSARGESLRPVLQALYDWGAAQADELDVSIAPPP
jgi:DNA-binding HxlR family transcriptional regulator